jgi:hypothetical protein
MPDPDRDWTVEEANQALPMVRSTLQRIQELVTAARRQREATAERRQGNGHARGPAAGADLRAAVEQLTEAGIVLRG